MKLAGKVAIVTGGSRGIGRAISVGFAREGAKVVVAARTETEMDKLPGTIHQTVAQINDLGGQAIPVKCDVTKEEEVEAMVKRALQEFGRVDVMVNNAAVAFYAPTMDTPPKRWDLVLRVNLMGTFLCCKAVLPHMVKQRSGSIINLSSRAADARHNSPAGVAYGVAKAAIEHYTFALAAEVAPYNIAVNCIKPGKTVDTEGMRLWNPPEEWVKWGPPDNMVKAAVFLAAQGAQGVTGTVGTDEEVIAWHAL